MVEGVTTGISAKDRARTILAAVAPEARPDDLARPGHIFPLRAREGGVLVRKLGLHAHAGTAWFRVDSLKLQRLPD